MLSRKKERRGDPSETDPEAPTSEAVRGLSERLIQICGGIRPRTVDGDAGIRDRFKKHRLFL